MEHTNDSVIVSYLTLRRSIGFIGILLPIILVLGAIITQNQKGVLPSISHYYIFFNG